jgi:probable FeS assembly SUF system protein SufT
MLASPAEFSFVRRECRAIRIPEGSPAVLSQGTRVRITQALGGSYTVATERGYLFRIEARDADALGKEPGEGIAAPEDASLEERIWACLRTCYDPEIPINVVDLGLIYSCKVLDEGRRVEVKMTLTAPGCGMGPILAQDVQQRIESPPEVETADVEVVFDPPWNQNMMSEAARLELGLF